MKNRNANPLRGLRDSTWFSVVVLVGKTHPLVKLTNFTNAIHKMELSLSSFIYNGHGILTLHILVF